MLAYNIINMSEDLYLDTMSPVTEVQRGGYKDGYYKIQYLKYKSKYIELKGGGTTERPSPAESATLYKINTIKNGNDDNKWIIVEDKNGIKRWKKYKKVTKKKDISINISKLQKIISKSDPLVKKIYNTLINNITQELNKIGIFIYILPIYASHEYNSRTREEYFKKTYGKDWYNRYLIIVNIYLDDNGNNIDTNKRIVIYFNKFDEKKEDVFKIFTKYLGNHYSWSGNNKDNMFIYYSPQKTKKKIDISKLIVGDYPKLIINIFTKRKDLIRSGIQDLLVIKQIEKLFEDTGLDFEYGMADIYITYTGLHEKDFKKIYPKLERILKEFTDSTNENEKIIHFEIEYWLDDNTESEITIAKKKPMPTIKIGRRSV